jgi:hypothetical protein
MSIQFFEQTEKPYNTTGEKTSVSVRRILSWPFNSFCGSLRADGGMLE